MVNELNEDIIKLIFNLYTNYLLSAEEVTMLLNKKSIEYVIKHKIYNVLASIDHKSEILFEDINIVNILEKNDLQEIQNKIIEPLKEVIERINKDYEGSYVDSIENIINVIKNKEKIKNDVNIIEKS